MVRVVHAPTASSDISTGLHTSAPSGDAVDGLGALGAGAGAGAGMSIRLTYSVVCTVRRSSRVHGCAGTKANPGNPLSDTRMSSRTLSARASVVVVVVYMSGCRADSAAGGARARLPTTRCRCRWTARRGGPPRPGPTGRGRNTRLAVSMSASRAAAFRRVKGKPETVMM